MAIAHAQRPSVTHRRLLAFKWLVVSIPPGAAIVTHAIGGTVAGHSLGDRLFESVLLALLLLAVAYVFHAGMFRIMEKLYAEATARERDMVAMDAVMQERERLSRELHDGAAQLVADLMLRLDTIGELVEGDRRNEAEAELARLRSVAGEIFEDISESISGLRTSVTERGLTGALRDYLDQFEERHGIRLRLAADGAADRLSPLAALQVFRLVQEALTNVRKHAAASEASVSLTSRPPGELTVVVADDGRGFGGDRNRGGRRQPLGLTSMRERVEGLGGRLEVSSQPGAGTRVTATIPLGRTKENGRAALATAAGR
ncbi:MAG: sensor histidine kinase [Dehalococcoidia bacterium]